MVRLRKDGSVWGHKQRGKTHCINGHDLSDARVYTYGGYTKRNCRQCHKNAVLRGGIAKPEAIEKVTQLLKRGGALNEATTAGKPTFIIAHNTFTRYRRENPAFDSFVTKALIGAGSRGQIRRHQRVIRAIQRTETNDYHAIRNMTPANLPVHVRDDITQDVMLALIEGRISRSEIRSRVREFVTAHNRMFPTLFAMRSLDAPAFRDGALPLVETISQGLWQ